MPGELTTITGPMGSGKTLRLIQFFSQYEKLGYETHLFKPWVDNRDNGDVCSSRAGYNLPATTIKSPCQIPANIYTDGAGQRLVAFEEAQFFGPELVEYIKFLLANTNFQVMVTGLNLDFRGEPFGIMPELMAMSDELIYLHGVCDVCHGRATKTQRLIDGKPAPASSPLVLIGGDDCYTCRCPHCYVPPT